MADDPAAAAFAATVSTRRPYLYESFRGPHGLPSRQDGHRFLAHLAAGLGRMLLRKAYHRRRSGEVSP